MIGIKRNKFSTIIFLTTLGYGSCLFAAGDESNNTSKNNALTEDSTVKHHERKVLLQLTDIGLSTRKLKLPVTYCPFSGKNKATKCHSEGVWEYKIDQTLEDATANVMLNQLGGKRYDILKIKAGKIGIKTIFENVEIDSTIENFNFNTGSLNEFSSSVEKYLNKSLKPLMLNLLAKAKDARYQEMPDKEQETFLATIAKDEGVPATVIQKLMSSSYVFSVYQGDLKGKVFVNQVEKKRSGVKYLTLDSSVSIKGKTSLVIFNFDPETNSFKLYSTLTGPKHSSSYGADFSHFPKKGMMISHFKKSFKAVGKQGAKRANIDLKDDDNFAIFATVDELEGNDIKARIGDLEDLRIDAPYNLYQQQDGKRVLVGWAKARSVASEAVYRDDNANYNSQFDLLYGDAEIQDSMREHPWSGLFLYAGLSNTSITLTDFDNTDATGGGSYSGINLGIKVDLGYVLNSPSSAERWLEMNVSLGGGGENLETNNIIGTFENTSNTNFSFLLAQRYYAGASGLYFGYKYGLGVSVLSGDAVNSDATLDVTGFGANLGLLLGYQTSPDNSYFMSVDLMYPFATQGTYDLNDDKTEYDVTLSPMINVTIGATFHVRSLSSLTSGL